MTKVLVYKKAMTSDNWTFKEVPDEATAKSVLQQELKTSVHGTSFEAFLLEGKAIDPN